MSKNFERTKQDLHNVDSLIDIKSNPTVATLINLHKTIPIIGGFIDIGNNLTTNLLSDFQQKKRDELLNIILSEKERITSDMVNDVEFLLNFAKTLDAVNRLATNDKVKYFANLLKNGYLSGNKIESNDFDEYLEILNELSYRQIKYLCLYNKCKKETEATGNPLQNATKVASKFKETLNVEDEKISQILNSIQRTVFMKIRTGYHNGTDDIYYLVDEFNDFAKWITGE